MSERKWTDEQLTAINDSSSDILVSAAAGSGKTAVLTKRLIAKVTDPDNPLDVTRMLVVTFTKDAAGELKQRIRGALSDAIATDPSNKRLKRQQLLLPSAKITTIHSFCFDLIRQNVHLLGISPSVKISEEAQSSLLMKQVAELVIDNYYAALPDYDDIEDFVTFADNFITLKDSSLSEILISQYKKLSSFPDGVDFLLRSVEQYNIAEKSFFDSVWGVQLSKQLSNELTLYKSILEDACHTFTDGGVFESNYLPAFSTDLKTCNRLLSAVNQKDYDLIRQTLKETEKVSLKSVKSDLQDSEVSFFRKERDKFHEAAGKCGKIITRYFATPLSDVQESAKKSKQFVINLHRFLSAFERRYNYEKSKRSILDFNDLERLAFKLLIDKDGSPSDVALDLSSQFDEICIDEYQDVNSIQDSIFRALSVKNNRFMVGDIKQSIYGFRGAMPTIFAKYRLDPSIRLISLTKNFRSDRPVIDFTNELCGNLFTHLGTTVPYDECDKLNFAKSSSSDIPVSFEVIVKEKAKSEELLKSEAEHVASTINSLIKNGEKPSDIAILLRSPSTTAQYFSDALSKYNIASKNNDEQDLFVNPAVLLVMCILNVIDNPSRDIYLAGALKSPIFNFSLNDLVNIRKYSSTGNLFDALLKYTEEKSFEKGKYFLKKLDTYRKLANEPVYKLIWHVYSDTGIFAITSSNGTCFKENLMMLYEHARKFESGSFKGLYNFIRYVNDIIDAGEKLPSKSKNTAPNAVSIMSIHKSKGLEFETVFLCDVAKNFNTDDAKKKVIVDEDFGVTLKLSDASGLGTVETVFRRISGIGVTMKGIDEQIRVLYVALTRARRRLCLVGSQSSTENIDEAQIFKRYPHTAGGQIYAFNQNYLFWTLVAQDLVKPNVIFSHSDYANDAESCDSTKVCSLEAPTVDKDKVEQFYREYKERFSFVYPSDVASKIPAKLSVSQLYPSILDELNDSEVLNSKGKAKIRDPRFIKSQATDGTDVGNATHQFMQFCSFNLLVNNGVEYELNRLIDKKYLSHDAKKHVNIAAIKRFSASELCSSLLSAKEIHREIRFNVLLPAANFTEVESNAQALTDENVLVQGIIDCLFIDSNDRLTIVDYKTDHIPPSLSKDEAENLLIERHISQLSYYAAACKSMIGKDVDRVLLYSFALNSAIEIPKSRLIVS